MDMKVMAVKVVVVVHGFPAVRAAEGGEISVFGGSDDYDVGGGDGGAGGWVCVLAIRH